MTNLPATHRDALAATATLQKDTRLTTEPIADYTDTTVDRLNPILTSLAEREFITREPASTDERLIHHAITKAGVEVLAELNHQYSSITLPPSVSPTAKTTTADALWARWIINDILQYLGDNGTRTIKGLADVLDPPGSVIQISLETHHSYFEEPTIHQRAADYPAVELTDEGAQAAPTDSDDKPWVIG